MSLNNSYYRVSPTGWKTLISPRSIEEVAYYKSLEKHGYTYEQA